MPIYEYQCRDSRKIKEFLVGVGKEKPELKCGSCGSYHLDKIISAGFFSVRDCASAANKGATCSAEGRKDATLRLVLNQGGV